MSFKKWHKYNKNKKKEEKKPVGNVQKRTVFAIEDWIWW